MPHRVFCTRLVTEMVENIQVLPVVRQGCQAANTGVLTRLIGQHFPEEIKGARNKSLYRSWCVCGPAHRKLECPADAEREVKKKSYGHSSNIQCDVCGVTLCASPCFKLYHIYQHPITQYIRNLQAQDAAEGADQEDRN